jgi:hypothetical protein
LAHRGNLHNQAGCERERAGEGDTTDHESPFAKLRYEATPRSYAVGYTRVNAFNGRVLTLRRTTKHRAESVS